MPDERASSARPLSPAVSLRQNLSPQQERLNGRTVRKLDFILLPFLSLLFLLNALDKSNIGNAEAAHFTKDLGLPESALNTSVACFFAVFVTMQPIGAALGRRYGMARWVPACMALWGVCTALHIAIRHEWQLFALRILVAALEAGFYPTTVSYLSLFYTRYEFGKRLGLFYGQAALAGAVGGLLSWAVFKAFPDEHPHPHLHPHSQIPPRSTLDVESMKKWKSWEILFLIEGCCTIVVALVGFVWLPHSADTAWFLSPDERNWAETRIRRDRENSALWHPPTKTRSEGETEDAIQDEALRRVSTSQSDEEADRLLSAFAAPQQVRRRASVMSTKSMTADSGLSRTDVYSALVDWKIWYLLVCNILSAIPATAFSVFLPLVIRGLSSAEDEMTPAKANLLAMPPFLAGTAALWTFTWWSDRSHQRLIPILWGLAILLAGLTATVMLPSNAYAARYVALTVLLSGSFIASPLTVAWLTNNISEPGKRAIVLGINGWGNLAGVFSAMLFAPRFAKQGYVTPFFVTLACVVVAFVGYLGFRTLLVVENFRRERIVNDWDSDQVEREALLGDTTLPGKQSSVLAWMKSMCRLDAMLELAEIDPTRRGDERMTFRYGL
ncbi:hypothetical protein MBLNU459_g3673t1 [Dothideomycetes sp. NU459]